MSFMNCGWERPPEYDDPPDDDCLNCGYCGPCIERSIECAREMNDMGDFEQLQKDATELTDEVARLRAGLAMIAQIIHGSTRTTCRIAEAVLAGADVRDTQDPDAVTETVEAIMEGRWKPKEQR